MKRSKKYNRKTRGKWNNGTITPVVENANYIKPLAAGYVVTSEYGERKNPVTGRMAMHSGIDISGQEHEGIKAVAGGTVTYAGVQSGYGNCVEIKHEIEGKERYTFYGHLSEIDVSLGEAVEQGKIIGKEGGGEGDPNRGTSTGAHLHFEIRNEKREVQNPRDYINF